MSRLASLVSRSRTLIRRRGVIGAATHVGKAAWNRLVNHRQLVYELPSQTASQFRAKAPESARVQIFRSLEEIPAGFVSDLTSVHGTELLQELLSTFRAGATLFLVLYDGRPATMLWVKRGTPAMRWYVPLASSDVVLYGGHTSPQYRGLNLLGLAMGSAMTSFSAQTERFLVDVKVWNKASIRAIEKAGFRLVLKTKPLK